MATDSAVMARPNEGISAQVMEQVIVGGDLERLAPADRVRYYRRVCDSLGLNPLTQPFQYIRLNNRLTLYATKTATDQLRSLKGISIDSAVRDTSDPDYATWLATGHDSSGRVDTEIGSVSIKGLAGEARANAIMKALTKAKRRLTLSLAGLGWLDEIEVDSVPSAQPVQVDNETGEITSPAPTLRQSITAAREAIAGQSGRLVDSAAGTVQGEPKAADGLGTDAPQAADPEPSADSGSAACGALPKEDGLGMTKPCIRTGTHRVHASEEGSWAA